MYRSPVDVYIDEWVYELVQAVERTGARRVLVDSLADLRMAAADDTRFSEFVYSLLQRFSRQGVSILMTHEIPDLFGAERISDSAVSPVRQRRPTQLCQGTQLHQPGHFRHQSRASHHEPDIRQFLIGPDGIKLADGLPAGQSRA